MEAELLELEELIARLATGHSLLADLVEEQQRAIRQADTAALAEVGARIESRVNEIAGMESRRREVCRRLAPSLGLPAEQAARAKLATICARLGGVWGRRLRRAAGQLAEQLDRVGRASRVNQAAAHRLAGFFGDLLGRIARIGRETGCYDARGRRALAREMIGNARSFSAVG
jgi:hypothetical protein